MFVCTSTPQASVEVFMHPHHARIDSANLAQLLVNAEIIHHDCAIQDFQQRVLSQRLLGFFRGPPQQQTLIPMAALNWGAEYWMRARLWCLVLV